MSKDCEDYECLASGTGGRYRCNNPRCLAEFEVTLDPKVKEFAPGPDDPNQNVIRRLRVDFCPFCREDDLVEEI